MQATAQPISGALPRQTRTSARIPLGLALLMGIPAFIPLVWTAFRTWRNGLVPTAFVQYDLPSYLANGRQSFVDGVHLNYGNPYASYGTPAIYFQPHEFLLGLLQKLGLSPDWAQIAFHLAAVAFAMIVAARLYEEWVGWNTPARKIGFLCFVWGGGVLALAGAAYGLLEHVKMPRSFLLFDAGDGWWMFNLGRNLVYPQEAYYHALFLLAILLLVRKKFAATIATAAVLSISHPFTGISLALILVLYAALELKLKSGAASWGLLFGSCAITALHLGYYMVFLNRFADHRALEAQWKLDWPYVFWTFTPALYLVGIFAFGPLTRWKNLAPALGDPRSRLCLVWFAVIFALTHHDLVMQSRQPIHFAHGYDWIALFLLGAPAIVAALEKLLAIRPRPAMILALGAFLALFLSDNLLWFGSFADPTVQCQAIVLTHDEKDVLDWLSHHASAPTYVASSDRWISYLTPTYTDVRTWHGHDLNTPEAASRKAELHAAFAAGKPLPTSNSVYYIPDRDRNWAPPAGASRVYSNGSYEVWLFQAH
ncbi:MAG: hypothetical protein ACLPWF_02840 [Bryobacteraceae bacterium]